MLSRMNNKYDDIKLALEKLDVFFKDVHNSCIREKPLDIQFKYDLDIIIPAYNVEKYIRECLDSVVNQKTKYRYRVIVIDDGSTDNTGKIIDEFADRENICIIHQANKGFSGARNAGLDLLNSKYVTFVDSDDMLYSDSVIESILNLAMDKGADIVQAGHFKFNDKSRKKFSYTGGKTTITKLKGYPWGKIYRATLFEKVKFPENYYYEDSVMRQIIHEIADKNKIYGTPDIMYMYRSNPNGITATSGYKPKSLDSLWITMQLYKDRQKLGLKSDNAYYDYLMHMAVLSYQRICHMPEEIKKSFFVVYSDFIKKNFEGLKSEKYSDIDFALRNKRYLYFKIYAKFNLGG